MSNILGIDLGRKHVGVALFRKEFGIEPLSSFSYKQQFDLKRILSSIIDEYQVTVLVVGDMGEETLPADLSKLLQSVCQEAQIELVVVTERFSSLQAEHEVYSSGGKINDQSHSGAAETILRDYLSQKRV